MRILLINKFLFQKGGADKHVFQLKALLEQHGHEVALFGMADPRNIPLTVPHATVSHVDFEHVSFSWQGLRSAARMFYSFEARRSLRKLVQEFKPDVAHVHNIYHQISPSVLPELRRAGVPVVYSIHDFHLLSPNYSLYADGKIDECVKPHHFWRAALHRCVKHSFLASSLAAAVMAFHRLTHIIDRNVDLFLATSQFYAKTMKEWEFPSKRLKVLPNFASLRAPRTGAGDFFLYVGRFSPEKGVASLVKAAAGLPAPVVLLGNGSEEPMLRRMIQELGATNITFTPYTTDEELQRVQQKARAVIVPSVWYENSPLAVLEAFAAGIPVIASNIGGLPELVQDGQNGLVVPPGDVTALRNAMQTLWDSPETATRLGQHAHEFAKNFTPEHYYTRLMDLYGSLLPRS